MTSDIRRTIGIITAIAGLGVLINATVLVIRAHPAPLQVTYDNDGHIFARVAGPHKARHGKRTGRSHRVARLAVHERSLPMPVALRFADPRPRAWCGWYMRQRKGLRDRTLNLARAWAHVGKAAGPRAGVIVVWPHHVGEIIRLTRPGHAIVLSGNDGGRVRIRERSIANAIAFREV